MITPWGRQIIGEGYSWSDQQRSRNRLDRDNSTKSTRLEYGVCFESLDYSSSLLQPDEMGSTSGVRIPGLVSSPYR
jgi:hypothetical protein